MGLYLGVANPFTPFESAALIWPLSLAVYVIAVLTMSFARSRTVTASSSQLGRGIARFLEYAVPCFAVLTCQWLVVDNGPSVKAVLLPLPFALAYGAVRLVIYRMLTTRITATVHKT